VIARLTLLALSDEIRRIAGRLEPAQLRTLDAIHLATALRVRDELDGFVCYDDRLIGAARSGGFAVFTPGLVSTKE